ncbi:TIGR00341 family protein [Paralimibaculum aggregatum]|uniref:TIGR00341 family protein n=1 Tax=Paralimibaculum aggregatum TaxID=3036245 RepID=A0ABQ6LC61_9RHOB|nr:TIGR00341 family protein [Limibaculum sp. NKW23]GMG80974.1 TIGR00341 family protein [Limibaculum sp. NKW23]
MPFRWIEVIAPESRREDVERIAGEAGISEVIVGPCAGSSRASIRLLAGEIDRQQLIDDLQDALETEQGWRIVLSDTEAVTPHTEEEKEREQASIEARESDSRAASREELFQSVVRGAALSRDYIVLVALSTVVAGIGLVKDDLAVIIGAMVIAPLLGPSLALAFATAVGDRTLLLRAVRSLCAGLAIAVGLALAIPLITEVDIEGSELSRRTQVDLGALALALASGAAAALSRTAGLSSALVGVMVSAALLPPAAALGIALASGAMASAAGAGLLLGINVAAVTLAAILTFLAKGVRPRTWHEREGAAQSLKVTVAVLAVALLAMSSLIALDLRPG